MPHFTLPLTQEGPVITAAVTVSTPRRAALLSKGLPVPPARTVRALVDTGASCTCVDPAVLKALGLAPTGSVMVNTPSTGNVPHQVDQYDANIVIFAASNQMPYTPAPLPVVAVELFTQQGIHVLIGRDVLAGCVLHYNGSQGVFTLAY